MYKKVEANTKLGDSHNDDLEQCLGQELENGRLVRLISKMGFINERPE